MKISLFTVSFAGFWGQARSSLEECIQRVAGLGFDGVEIMGKRPHLSPLDCSVEDCSRLGERARQCGIEVSAVAAYTDFTGGMNAAEVPFLEMQIAYIEALAVRARALGTRLIRVFSSYERDDVPFAQQWQRTVTGIRECADRAREHGVTIGIQNHHDIGVATKTLLELIGQVGRENVIPMFDCWSAYLRGEDPAAGVCQVAPRMQFTTVADYITLPRSRYRPDLINYWEQSPPFVLAVPMGSGELPYASFFNALRECGFDGWVSYEMCSPVREGGEQAVLDRYARAFIDYMKPWKTSR